MKRSAEKISDEADDEDSGLRVVKTNRGNGAAGVSHSSDRDADQRRPEIAVLAWNVRSYRLSLRENKG